MKNKPNMFRVEYSVFEGDNYAGGYIHRTKDIDDLGDAIKFENIVSILPIYIEFGKSLDKNVILDAIKKRKKSNDKKNEEYEIKKIEKRLKELKSKM